MGPLNELILAVDRRALGVLSRTSTIIRGNMQMCVEAMVAHSKRRLTNEDDRREFIGNYLLKIVIDMRTMQPTIVRFCTRCIHYSCKPLPSSRKKSVMRFFTYMNPATQIRPLQFVDGRIHVSHQLIRCSFKGVSFSIIHPLSAYNAWQPVFIKKNVDA